jgi:hypothetical protein
MLLLKYALEMSVESTLWSITIEVYGEMLDYKRLTTFAKA